MDDLRILKVGDKTNHGTIKSIYGVAKDYIIFFNEDDESKVISSRTDDKYIKAWEEGRRLDAEAIKKFNSVHRHKIKVLAATGFVNALKSVDNKADVKEHYKALVEFINDNKRVKHIFGEGPNSYHVVYLNEDNCVGMEIKLSPGHTQLPEHVQPPLNELVGLKHLSENGLPKLFRSSASEKIGRAMIAVIRSTPNLNLESDILEAKIHVEGEIRDFFHMEHQLISIVLIIWLGLLAFLFVKPDFTLIENQIFICALGGGLGAMMSSLQRSKRGLYGLQETFFKLLLQAISRLLLGFISGSLIIPLTKSNLALGIINNNMYGVFVFSVIAGFSERFIPDILGGLSKSEKE